MAKPSVATPTSEIDRRRDRIAELSSGARGKSPTAVPSGQDRPGVTRVEDLANLPVLEADPHFFQANSATIVARPKGYDPHPLRASYACPDFDHEVIPGAPVDAIVGETLRLALATPLSQVDWTVVRTPGGSAARFIDGQICPDVPGLYVLDVRLGGGWTREVQIVAYPESARHQMIYPPKEARRSRVRLRAITRDQNITPASIIVALEAGERGPVDFGRMIPGFNISNYHAN